MRAAARSLALALLLGATLAGAQTQVTCGPTQAGCGPAMVGAPGAAPSGAPLPTWVNSTLASWMLDEPSGTRVNLQGTTTRNLAQVGGTVTNNATSFMEGTASAEAAAAGTYLSSTDTTLRTMAAPLTCGFWARSTGTGNQNALYGSTQGCCGGFILYYGGDQIWRATLQDASFGGITLQSSAGVVATNAWAHIAVVAGLSSSALYQNGKQVALQSWTYVTPASSAEFAATGSAAGHFVPGEMDELWCINQALTAASICRICSCGIRGEQCLCNGAAYVSTGRNASACGACTLVTPCNVATPQ